MIFGPIVAHAATRPPRPRALDLTILRADTRTVTVPATPWTTTPGVWGMFVAGGGHLRVAGTPDVAGGEATWPIHQGAAVARRGRAAGWSGIVHRDPAAADLSATDHLFPAEQGTAPAWVIGADPGDLRPVWAVHIHGMGSSRAGMLRGVLAASEVGLPSVVVTYRNSEEGPRRGSGRSTLGWNEARDVAAVLEELTTTRRVRFILFGWSMGAQIALRLAASARFQSRILGMVLDSPALVWPNVLKANAVRAGLPGIAGIHGASWMSGSVRARLIGLERPVPFDRMDWVSRAREIPQPVLVHHGSADWSAPLADAEAFAAAAPAAMLRPNAGGHTTGWNVDPSGWADETVRFTANLLR